MCSFEAKGSVEAAAYVRLYEQFFPPSRNDK